MSPSDRPHDEGPQGGSHDVAAMGRSHDLREPFSARGLTGIDDDVDARVGSDADLRGAGNRWDAHVPQRHHAVGEGRRRRRFAIPRISRSGGLGRGRAQIRALFASYFSNTWPSFDRMFLPSPACTELFMAKRSVPVHLEDIPNVGPSLAADLRRVGVNRPQDLKGRKPIALYQALCEAS